MNIQELPLKNSTTRLSYHNTNYRDDPFKRNQAINKCLQTKLKNYGTKNGMSKEFQSNIVKSFYKTQNAYLNSLDIKFNKEELFNTLNSEQFHYSKYMKKSGNRSMIKENPELYKSLLYHTNEYQKVNRFRRMVLSFRLLIAGKYNFKFSRDQYCRCGKYIMFDPPTQELRQWKSYCKKIPGCMLQSSTKEHYQYVYGDDWESFYNERIIKPKNTPERHKIRQLAGRMAYQKRQSNKLTKFHAIGNNEKYLLDKQEEIDNCKIDRNFTVLGYYPDGYCHESNTIYEVYEKYHKHPSMVIKDKIRTENIIECLNCKFVVIWDNEKKSKKS